MDQATLLITLQDTDFALLRAQKRLSEMPQKTAVLEARKRTRELETLLSKTQRAQDEVDHSIHRHEDEASGFDSKIASEQKKLMSGEVNNPKEVQNISREMDSLRRQKEKLENGILEEMEKREKVAEHLTKVQTAIKVSEKKEAAAIRDFQTTGTEIQAEIDRLNATRVTVAREMEAGLLARYESLRDAKHGIGAGLLRDDGCSACRMELPSERVQALQESGSPIGECPMCHRLLVVRLAPDPEER